MSYSSIPKGWLDYSNWGTVVPGTKFLPFKVPLKETIKVPEEKRHTTKSFMASNPNVKLIINLTDTNNGRYYNYEDFISKGISIIPIRVQGGGRLPSSALQRTFADAVKNFMNTTAKTNPDALIGVHCTHGLNRTGFFICRYMVDYMGCRPQVTLESYQAARGHNFDRENYINDIMK